MKEQPITPVTGLSDDLVRLGIEGTHPLFEARWIRRAFDRLDGSGMNHARLLSAHHALRVLAALDRFEHARAYLAELPTATLDLVIFLYFRTLDREINQAGPTIH